MPLPNYQVLGSLLYSNHKRDFAFALSSIPIVTDYSAIEADLAEFLSKLHLWKPDYISSPLSAIICANLKTQVMNRIFVPNAPFPLSPANPIHGVYVSTSRESADEDSWRDYQDNYAIHPVVGGSGIAGDPFKISVGLQPDPKALPHTPDNAQYWILADVFAYKPPA